MLWRAFVAAAMILPAAAAAQPGQAPVEYDVAFPNAVHHEARIDVTFREVTPGPLTVRMSRSSPGRYAIHEFAKNVYDVSAADGTGRALTVTRDDPYSWIIPGHDGTVTVSYTLYADRADGTYSQIDETHAHLNMPSAFLWAPGYEDRPITVQFRPYDDDWRVATQLAPTRNRFVFEAPHLQYFLDSPTELSDFDVREWQVRDGDGRYTIRLAVHHAGTEEDVDRFAEMAKNIVDEQIRLFGDVPDFDYGSYTFIADYLPHVSGDGMEHRNSTILTSSAGLYEADFAQLNTLSHEFIHAWNVERLRPAELEPFDFTRANPTPSLWFAEGFTSYYGPLTILRAGESSVDDYLERLGGTLSRIINAPGRRYGSPQDMSLRAAFVDAATSVDPTNFVNTFVSYYPYGAIIALALDLSIRQRFPGLSLDDYMRHLWQEYGKPETPYTHAMLRAGLADVTGDKAFAEAFFAQYVEAPDLPDFGPLLEQAGLFLEPVSPDMPWAGPYQMDNTGQGMTLQNNTLIGTPLYETGLDRGDEILRVGRFRIRDDGDFARALEHAEPGDRIEIRFRRHDRERTAELTLAGDPALHIIRFEDAGREISDAQRAFREAWLGADDSED